MLQSGDVLDLTPIGMKLRVQQGPSESGGSLDVEMELSPRSSGTPLHIHDPAMRFGEYFEALTRLANSGAIKSSKVALPSLIRLSMLMTRYPLEIQPVNPAAGAMRSIALIGRALGYKV